MMRLVRIAVCCLVALPLLVTAPGAEPQQPTFRSATALVQVDAIVVDKDQRFVRGLRAEDVELFEDGKPQKIEQFYLVTHDPVTRASSIAADDAGRPAEQAHRLFVLAFDEGHLGPESIARAKQGAEAFVMKHIGPGDVGAVLVNGELHLSKLTTDKGALLSGIRAVKPGFTNRQALLAPFREFPRINTETDAAQIAMGSRELLRRMAADACREDPPACAELGAMGGENQVQNMLQQKARQYVREARLLTAQTTGSLEALVGSLGRFAGRKTVVFITEGFFMEESRASVERLGAQASRAGVTIYTIDARGLMTTTGAPDALAQERFRSMAFDTGDDGPSVLTSTTGGIMIRNIDNMQAAFSRIADDTSTYYVIGYSPANGKMDGKFRKIEVRTKAAGARVRARRGYLATPLPVQESYWR
ncbi:MAG: VWA domain-containing protein [Acidobacteriota bacterium]|nr:VWA domain-containing protein [Acidobacteriota bacterium]